MANWFTRGISRVNSAIRTGLDKAFGGEQPQATPTGRDYRYTQPTAVPTPADYAEAQPVAGEEPTFVQGQLFEAPPGTPSDIFGQWVPEVTLYDDYMDPVETNRAMGVRDWMHEAQVYNNFELQQMYGLDAQDIVRQLVDEGYDYKYWAYNSKGELREYSGLWRDWREDHDSP